MNLDPVEVDRVIREFGTGGCTEKQSRLVREYLIATPGTTQVQIGERAGYEGKNLHVTIPNALKARKVKGLIEIISREVTGESAGMTDKELNQIMTNLARNGSDQTRFKAAEFIKKQQMEERTEDDSQPATHIDKYERLCSMSFGDFGHWYGAYPIAIAILQQRFYVGHGQTKKEAEAKTEIVKRWKIPDKARDYINKRPFLLHDLQEWLGESVLKHHGLEVQ